MTNYNHTHNRMNILNYQPANVISVLMNAFKLESAHALLCFKCMHIDRSCSANRTVVHSVTCSFV